MPNESGTRVIELVEIGAMSSPQEVWHAMPRLSEEELQQVIRQAQLHQQVREDQRIVSNSDVSACYQTTLMTATQTTAS